MARYQIVVRDDEPIKSYESRALPGQLVVEIGGDYGYSLLLSPTARATLRAALEEMNG